MGLSLSLSLSPSLPLSFLLSFPFRHDSELKAAMAQLGYTKSERDIAHLMSQHEVERSVLEAQWRGEINHQQIQQRKGYRQWMDGVYEEMVASGGQGFWPGGVALVCACLFVCFVFCMFTFVGRVVY